MTDLARPDNGATPEAALLDASDAAQWTVVRPMAKVLPESGAHFATRAPSQASAASTTKRTIAPVWPVNSTTMFVGQEIAGGVVSCSVIVWLTGAEILPQ